MHGSIVFGVDGASPPDSHGGIAVFTVNLGGKTALADSPMISRITMTSETIQERLRAYQPRTFLIDPAKKLRPASVIILWNESSDKVLFTVRAGHMRKHAGQISFPGGALDEGESPVEAAIREAQEEIGVLREDVRILGEIDRFQSISHYLVQCFVAAWSPSQPLRVNTEEIDSVFETPLAFFLDPANCKKEHWNRAGIERDMFLWNWEGRVIWGLTARFLASLFAALMGTDLSKAVPLTESTQAQFESLPTYYTDAD